MRHASLGDHTATVHHLRLVRRETYRLLRKCRDMEKPRRAGRLCKRQVSAGPILVEGLSRTLNCLASLGELPSSHQRASAKRLQGRIEKIRDAIQQACCNGLSLRSGTVAPALKNHSTLFKSLIRDRIAIPLQRRDLMDVMLAAVALGLRKSIPED